MSMHTEPDAVAMRAMGAAMVEIAGHDDAADPLRTIARMSAVAREAERVRDRMMRAARQRTLRPSVRALGRAAGVSPATIQHRIARIETETEED